MKDRRIGIPEVIEKFGVPPEKVVEVQALAGDSSDNVPGVPGIGIKTAAQLIVEYGDLETLLLRAGEIKQPKRREALIEHAEKARISRKLVLLDDKVALDVPLDELAVHEPDARKLIAFQGDGIFHPDPPGCRLFGDRSGRVDANAASKSGFNPRPPAATANAAGGTGDLFAASPPRAKPGADKQDKAASLKGIADSARRRPRRSRATLPVDRSKYLTLRSLDELKAWIARAQDVAHLRDRCQSRFRSIRCRPRYRHRAGAGAERCLLCAAGHKQSGGGAGLFDAGLAPDQIKAADALAALKPLLEEAGVLKSDSTSSSTP